MITIEEVLLEKSKKAKLPIYGHILVFIDSVPNISYVHQKLEQLLQQTEVAETHEYCILPLHGLIEH